MYKNLSKVHVYEPINNYLSLGISINQVVDSDWKKCYEEALAKRDSIVTWRSTGAPTLNKVTFEGSTILTQTFPNNDLVMNDVKAFLKELDDVVGIANELYDDLLLKKEKAAKLKEEEQNRKKEELKKLEDFLNN